MPNPVVALRLPPELLSRIDERARREGTDRSGLIREILTEQFGEQRVGPALQNPRTKLRPPLRRL